MSGELVLYWPKAADPHTARQRRRRNQKVIEEGRKQLNAILADVRERNPDIAEFADLMTASLGAVLIEQELRAMREVRERLTFKWSY